MTNVIITSSDPVAQQHKDFLIKTMGYSDRLADIHEGGTLRIIGHDTEMANGDAFIRYVTEHHQKPTVRNFKIELITCYAASTWYNCPAQKLADFFDQPVRASRSKVFTTYQSSSFFAPALFSITADSSTLFYPRSDSPSHCYDAALALAPEVGTPLKFD